MIIRAGFFHHIHRWDVFTFQRIVASRLHSSSIKAARLISRTGDGWACVLVPMALLMFGFPGTVRFAIACAVACAVERAIYLVAKRGFKRRRPPNVVPGYRSDIVPSDEFSFPSGHTSAAFLIVTLPVLFYGHGFAVMYVWSTAVGISRIILGVHFPTDVLVGAFVGIGVAVLVALLVLG